MPVAKPRQLTWLQRFGERLLFALVLGYVGGFIGTGVSVVMWLIGSDAAWLSVASFCAGFGLVSAFASNNLMNTPIYGEQ